jgi:hypothetical protein
MTKERTQRHMTRTTHRAWSVPGLYIHYHRPLLAAWGGVCPSIQLRDPSSDRVWSLPVPTAGGVDSTRV